MRVKAVRALCITAVVAGLAGCQSSPRWAWWKPKEAAEDTSLLARSAAPALPSSQSTPQVVESGNLQPAAPPSSANLAAAGTQPTVPAISLPGPSPGTLANAPAAQYPPTGSPSATSSQGALNAISATPSAAASPIVGITVPNSAPPVAATSVPAAGPYDPNGYRPGTAIATTSTDGESSAASEPNSTPVADRYALAPANASRPAASPSADRYAMPPQTPVAAPVADDHYGRELSDRYSDSPATPATPVMATAAPAPNSAATVQLSAPAGQYRPGGTSSYVSGSANQQIEVASRPAPTASADVTPQGVAPASVPWSPPINASPESVPGTRTY
jgi:hypothetical protein